MLRGIDLRGAHLNGINLRKSDLRDAISKMQMRGFDKQS